MERLGSSTPAPQAPATGNEGTRKRGPSALPRLLPAAILALGAALVLAAGPAQAYLWERSTEVTNPITGLRLTEISLPKSMKLEWNYTPLGSNPPRFSVERRQAGGAWTTLVTRNTTDCFWVDTTPFDFGVTYEYQVSVFDETAPSTGLPPPPDGANPQDIHQRQWCTDQKAISVTPVRIEASANQAVDSRLDLRYAQPTLLDFQFGLRTYRGGLFAGLATDPSRVGRSFLKFTLPQLPAGKLLWAGSANVYYLRNFANDSATVGLQIVSDVWDAPTLKWSISPYLTPAAAAKRTTVTYDGTAASARWCSFPMAAEIQSEQRGDGLLSLALTSVNEGANGWAYFAKKEYDAALVPCLLYAYGAPLSPLEVSVSPSTIADGGSAVGQVTINDSAPTGGAVVTLASSNPSVASVPGAVTVPAGTLSTTFTVSTGTVASDTTVEITATYNGITRKAPLTVVPSGASLTVTYPNGGEPHVVGTNDAITWTTSGLTGNVKIEYSLQGGAPGTWWPVYTSTPNDGNATWTVQGPPSTQARIRITSTDQPTVSDASNASFPINPPSIRITYPNGGEPHVAGTNDAITWTSAGVTGNVKIEYSLNGGTTWAPIYTSTPNDGNAVWTVQGPPTTQARIRITSLNDPAVFDISDANFPINAP
jgi:hypothetical protein